MNCDWFSAEIALELLGIHQPVELIGQDPYEMYKRLCELIRVRHDPCVIDVFISNTHFINGGKSKPWWYFTYQRKRKLEQAKRSETAKRSASRTFRFSGQ